MSTFPYFIRKIRTTSKQNNDNNIDKSKEKRQLAVERGVKNRGDENSCVCLLVSPSELIGGLLALIEKCGTCLCSVPPAEGAVCSWVGVERRGENWQSLAGRQRGGL